MKWLKYFGIFFFCSQIIIAQVIASDPLFPTEQDTIVITFYADRAQRTDLRNYTGTVYAHTGAITNLTYPNWTGNYDIGSWGNNTTQPAMTRISENTYQVTIRNIRLAYNVPSNLQIKRLGFVFRNENGSKQTENLYLDIYEPGLVVTIDSPVSLPIYPAVGQAIDFNILCNKTAALSLLINGQIVAQANSNALNYTYTATEKGRKKIIYTAAAGNETFSDTSYMIVHDDVTVQNLPSGANTGVNYVDGSTVTLALYAPGKDFVYLIGDFNNWEFDPANNESWDFNPDFFMNQTPDGNIFWKTITGLTPGQEYGFQYLVNGNLRIADPYTEKVLDPWNDSSISSSTYPELKAYPTGETSEITSVFQTQQEEYQWTSVNYQKPDKEKLVIYELLIRDFIAEHDFKTVKDSLNYLKTLGVNAIELMPINEFEGNNSWGYNPSFYFAVDKYYGPAKDLKAFIDECHKNNIAVIMDIVLNHSYGQSPLVRLYSYGNYGPPTSDNPWYNVTSPNSTFSWGYDFNHESPQTEEFVDRVTEFWLTEYKMDGFRFDFTKGFTQKPGDGWSYDASRVNILKRIADHIWSVTPDAYVIFEHLSDNSEETILANYGIMLWGNMNSKYNEATMGYNENNKSDISSIFYSARGWNEPRLVGYMESHDEERLMYKNTTYGNSNSNYNTKSYNIALQRMKMAGAFFFTVPGPKMIWQFGELGYDYSINYNGRLGEKPITWDYYQTYGRLHLFKTYAELIKLKKNYPVFSTSDFSINLNGVVKTMYLNNDAINVAIAGNFDVISNTATINFQNAGKWYDFFSGDSIDVPYLPYVKSLQPGEFHIYSNVKFPTPEPELLSGVEENNRHEVSANYSLSQNYPNPFNPSTIISYSLAERGFIKLRIFNLLGQEIKTLVNTEMSEGNHSVTWYGDNNHSQSVAGGIYIYRIETNNHTLIRKMVLHR